MKKKTNKLPKEKLTKEEINWKEKYEKATELNYKLLKAFTEASSNSITYSLEKLDLLLKIREERKKALNGYFFALFIAVVLFAIDLLIK